MRVTFLHICPEFGDTKFGPFTTAEIRLGSDPDVNDVFLASELGVAPEHLKLHRQNANTYLITPVDPTAIVYIRSQGSAEPVQIRSPTTVSIGDSFSLVDLDGPTFSISTAQLADHSSVRHRATGVAYTIPQYLRRFVRAGQVFNPIYIVVGVLMFTGWSLASGATSIAISQISAKNTVTERWYSCVDQRTAGCTSDSPPTVPIATRSILLDREWSTTLRDDSELYRAFAYELENAFARAEQFQWAYESEESKTVMFRRHLRRLPESLVATLAYAAARPSPNGPPEWSAVQNSDGISVCGRGPLALTYRQAIHLGLENVQLDALVSHRIALSDGAEWKRAELLTTADFQDPQPELASETATAAEGSPVQGGMACLHTSGDDDRNDLLAIARRLEVLVGPEAPGLPTEGQPYWVAARLLKLGTMDFAHSYDPIAFNSPGSPPMQSLAAQDVLPRHREYAATYAAKVMANAVVTRCMAVLDKETVDNEPEFMGRLPDLSQCAVIKTFTEYGRL